MHQTQFTSNGCPWSVVRDTTSMVNNMQQFGIIAEKHGQTLVPNIVRLAGSCERPG